MPKLSKTACSGAFILHCTATGKEIKGCFCDDSPNGDNYRGELLGGLGSLLLLKAAFLTSAATGMDQATIQLASQSLYYENKGVISHGNDLTATLRSEQPQVDLIQLLKSYTRDLPCKITWIHVKGHTDDQIPFEELSLPQQVNVSCDEIAKIKLIDAIADGSLIDLVFPYLKISPFRSATPKSAPPSRQLFTNTGVPRKQKYCPVDDTKFSGLPLRTSTATAWAK
jgi:hypothetical protein